MDTIVYRQCPQSIVVCAITLSDLVTGVGCVALLHRREHGIPIHPHGLAVRPVRRRAWPGQTSVTEVPNHASHPRLPRPRRASRSCCRLSPRSCSLRPGRAAHTPRAATRPAAQPPTGRSQPRRAAPRSLPRTLNRATNADRLELVIFTGYAMAGLLQLYQNVAENHRTPDVSVLYWYFVPLSRNADTHARTVRPPY